MKTTSSQMNYGERSKNVEQDEVKELTYSHMMDGAWIDAPNKHLFKMKRISKSHILAEKP